MGQGQQGGELSDEQQRLLSQQHQALEKIEGFQLVRLLPHSPAHHCGLVPYFDIITALDHIELGQQEENPFVFFKNFIAERREKAVCFTVYNLRLRGHRDVMLTPSSAWGGGGLLGCSIEWVGAAQAVQRCWHIVEILEGSPAAHCPDLHADRDYIIGMQQPEEQLVSLLKSEEDFYARLSMWQDLQRSAAEQHARYPHENIVIPHTLLFLIYDVEENRVKEVLVDMGTRPGSPLGINVATGLLHLIPSATDSSDMSSLPVMDRFYLPRDLSFETDYPQPNAAAPQQQPPAAPAEGIVEEGNPPHSFVAAAAEGASVPTRTHMEDHAMPPPPPPSAPSAFVASRPPSHGVTPPAVPLFNPFAPPPPAAAAASAAANTTNQPDAAAASLAPTPHMQSPQSNPLPSAQGTHQQQEQHQQQPPAQHQVSQVPHADHPAYPLAHARPVAVAVPSPQIQHHTVSSQFDFPQVPPPLQFPLFPGSPSPMERR